MSKVVPEGWKLESLGKYANEKSLKFDGKSTIPVLSVTKYDGFVNSLSYFNKQVFSRDLTSYKVVKRGQFAYATIHLDEGSLGLLSDCDEGLISPMYTVFETKNGLDSKFLFYLMKSDLYMTKYPSLGQGSINRRMSISFRVLSDLAILYPPLPEQQKIASILTSVDEVIEKTQSQINKLQDLKKGTMNELLTRGIGHTEFKDSPIGRIPVGWQVKKLSHLTNVIDSLHKTPVFSSDGYPMVRVTDIKTGNVTLERTERVDEDVFLEFVKKYAPTVGDILMSRVGSYGVCSYVKTKEKFCIGQNTVVIHPSGADSRFLYYSLNSLFIQNQIENEVAGSGYKSLSLLSIRNLDLIIPPLPEQQKIASILSSIDTNIEEKQRKLQQTQSLKKSLMQDLLTGKVRVTVH
jgi:type I restriction enzyme, S subunit